MRVALALVFVAATASGASIAETAHTAMNTQPYDAAVWFILVEEENGNVLFEHNAQKLAIPASVRKLFSSATVADCLGLDARMETQLWIDGQDLVLRGGGDPSFGSDRFHEPEESAFDPFVRALRQRNVTSVRDIIVDVSMFDRVTLPYQWKLGNITSGVAAPIDAVTYSENDIGAHAVASAGHFAGLTFREVLEANQIAVTGRVRVDADGREWQELIATVESPFVYELLATILKPSHNLFAETLLKRVSADGEPASYEDSLNRERLLLTERAGIDKDTFRFVDASGLAPDDLVTPAAIVKILRWMDDPIRRNVYWSLLAEPGAEEGTLRRRLIELAPRLRAKTGTVAGVASLAGIIRGRDGRTRYFAVIVNHHLGSSSGAAALIDSIVRAASDF